MNPKTIKTLLVIFVGLVLIIFEINWLDKSAKEKTSVKADFSLEKIDGEKVEKIIISKDAEKKELTRTDEQWLLNDKKVAAAEIEDFFTELRRAKILEIASKNKDNQANFGLTDGQAYALEIIGGSKSEQKFLIGKSGAKGDSFYVKKEGSDKVYLAGGKLLSKITQAEDAWLEQEKKEEGPDAAQDTTEKK